MLHIQESSCPHCGAKINATFAEGESVKPKSGDLSVCMECFGLMMFGDEMIINELTDEQWLDLPAGVRGSISREIAQMKALKNILLIAKGEGHGNT